MRPSNMVTTNDSSIPTPFFLHDGEHWRGFNKEDIKVTFDYSHKELTEKLKHLGDIERKLTHAEEREFVFLLEILMQSHKLLHSTQEELLTEG